MPHFVLAAGELSGDSLGASLIASLRQRWPDARFSGIAGPRMRDVGCDAWYDTDEISVMGLAEIIRHVPRLRRILAGVADRVVAERPDAFIGIDAPDFNLRLARRIRKSDVRTVQYVAPTVWAWRESRVRVLRRACDLVLCILPFEEQFLADRGVRARFVGHPLADEIDTQVSGDEARGQLGLSGTPVVALLPGSRSGEIERLAPVFADTAAILAAHQTGMSFVIPAATPAISRRLNALFRNAEIDGDVQIVDGRARLAMTAADVSLIASGTATLECMLLGCPMVMAYRTSPVTAAVIRSLGLMKIQRFALPNLLSGEAIVEEYLQEDASPDHLAQAVQRLLESDQAQREMRQRFAAIGRQLKCNASDAAASAVGDLLGSADS